MNPQRLVEALDGGGRTVEYAGLEFTHLDRVMWPESGYTKRTWCVTTRRWRV